MLLLITGCVLIVVTFGILQLLLIMKTYKLEKASYIAELRHAIVDHLRVPVETLHSSAVDAVIKVVKSDQEEQQDIGEVIRAQLYRDQLKLRSEFSKTLRKVPELSQGNYLLSYPCIVLRHHNKVDTLVSSKKQALLEIAGMHIPEKNRLLISDGTQITSFDKIAADGQASKYTLEISIAQYTDSAAWQSQVSRRMAASFLSAAFLVILIVLVLFSILAALLRQKKIADIKTDFSNNITHELKTPISTAGIILKTLLIIDPVEDKVLFKEQLSALQKQHDKITRTVDWVLESAMTIPAPFLAEEIHVSEWLNELIGSRPDAEHRLSVECNPDDRINSNQTLLSGILGNLLDNAVKYSGAGTKIIARFYVDNQVNVFEVEDEGTAIPIKCRPHLFDKFYRIPEQEYLHSVKGLGLGLYLSQRNATALGGQLRYMESADGGNCFQLTIRKNEI